MKQTLLLLCTHKATFEPSHEKTKYLSFRPGLNQTSPQARSLKFSDLSRRGVVLPVK